MEGKLRQEETDLILITLEALPEGMPSLRTGMEAEWAACFVFGENETASGVSEKNEERWQGQDRRLSDSQRRLRAGDSH